METKISIASMIKPKRIYEDIPWSYSTSSEEEQNKKPYKLCYIKKDISSSSSSSTEDETQTIKAFEKKLLKDYAKYQYNPKKK